MSLRNWIGAEAANRLLENVQPFLGWDGGYWEQRARAARGMRRYQAAEQFAAKGAHELQDTQRLSTLGETRLWRAANDSNLSLPDAFELVEKGVKDLEEAFDLRMTNPRPVVNALSGLASFLSQNGRGMREDQVTELMFMRNAWSTRAKDDRMTSLRGADSEIARANEVWDRALADFNS